MSSIRMSVAINAGTHVISLAVTLASMAVVSRLLTPEEIGLFSVAASVTAFGHVFRDFGIGQYLVQVKDANRDVLRSAFTVMLCFSWLIALALYLSRHPVSVFYGYDGVADVMAVLALSFLILPFGAPHMSMLRRNMKFGHISFVNVTNVTVQAATTIVLAMEGASYMSMAWGAVAGNIVNVLILMALRLEDGLLLPKLSGIGGVLKFGTNSSAISVSNLIGSSAPDLIMGRTLGVADVAIFSRAAGLPRLVLNNFVNVIRGVYFPAFAERVRAGSAPAAIYLHGTSQLLGIIVPLLALMALIADPLIEFLFGDQWGRAAPLASFLCCYAMVGAAFSLADVSLVAIGKLGLLVRGTFIIQSVRVAAVSTSLFFPLEYVVVILSVATIAECIVYSRALHVAIDLTPRALWRAIWRCYALVPGCLIGPSLVLLMAGQMSEKPDNFWILAASGLSALPGWLLGIHLLNHPLRIEIKRLLRLA